MLAAIRTQVDRAIAEAQKKEERARAWELDRPLHVTDKGSVVRCRTKRCMKTHYGNVAELSQLLEQRINGPYDYDTLVLFDPFYEGSDAL